MTEDDGEETCAEQYDNGCPDCPEYDCPYTDNTWTDPMDEAYQKPKEKKSWPCPIP